ncbi:MAG: hypothetical protein ACTSQK_08675 [Candidatus Heimdallarchaeota archaeon]
MIKQEAKEAMGKERKSSEEIIPIIAEILTTDQLSINALSKRSDDKGTMIRDDTFERHIKLIIQIQELFKTKQVCYKEEKFGQRTYKVAWVEPIEK